MNKVRRSFFLLCLSLIVFGGLPAALAALDIKTVFLKLDHAKFKESIRPLVGAEEVTSENLTQAFEAFRVVDLKNHYMHLEEFSATGPMARTYVLYFSQDGLPIFVGSEVNRGDYGKPTDFFALCQAKAGNWSDCTNEIFPAVTLTDLLTPGAKLDPIAVPMMNLYYELPRKGTTVYLKVQYNNYSYSGMEPKDQKNLDQQLRKFRKQKFPLVWDKKNQKLVLTK